MSDHEEIGPEEALSLGAQLQRAREAKGMSLDDVASRTRIPIRHLQNIEREEWDALPAATYAIGFTRNYANAVGLDGATLARDLRARIGGPSHRAAAPEYYEQADPARVPPRSLALIAVLIAAALIGGYLYWRSTLDAGPEAIPPLAVPEAGPAPTTAPAPSPQAATGQPVTLVATGEVWMRITEGPSGPSIFTGAMIAGDRYQVPSTAQRPVIRTRRPQNVRVTVGAQDLGPLEPVERTIQNVSLLPQDLVQRAGSQPPAPPAGPLSAPLPASPPT